jgi:hypothetical protein
MLFREIIAIYRENHMTQKQSVRKMLKQIVRVVTTMIQGVNRKYSILLPLHKGYIWSNMIFANSKVVHLQVVDIWAYMCNVNTKLNGIYMQNKFLKLPH